MVDVQGEAGADEDEEMVEESDDEEENSESESEDTDDKPGDGAAADSDNDGASEPHSTSSRRSRAPSPTDSLVEHTASMQLSTPVPDGNVPSEGDAKKVEESEDEDGPASTSNGVKDRVASDLTKQRSRQSRYHTKRSTRKIGRPKGSKAKQDTRVKLDNSGFWD